MTEHDGGHFNQVVRRCESCSIRKLCFPAALSSDELAVLERQIRKTPPIDRGGYLYRAGEPFSGLYVVRTGSFKCSRILENGEERVVGLYIRGDLFGLDGLVSRKHSLDAVALEKSAACVLQLPRIDGGLKHLPGFCDRIFTMLGSSINDQYTMQMLTGTQAADERLARFLVHFVQRLESHDLMGHEFSLPLSRRELANYLGLQLATVSRSFGNLRDQGIIRVDRRLVSVVDFKGLQEAASLGADELVRGG